MRKYIKCLIVLILMMPILIYADNYNSAENSARSIFTKEEYKNTWNRYLQVVSASSHGELITLEEYRLSMKKGKTYLFYGLEYWTKSKDSNGKVYSIRIQTNSEISSNDLKYSSTDADYNTRVGVYVKPGTKVNGSGTYKDPWSFNPVYRVNAKVNNIKYGEIKDEDEQYREAMCSSENCTSKIKFTINEKYRYLDNDCLGEVITATKSGNTYSEFTTYENGKPEKVAATPENNEKYKKIFESVNEDGKYGDAKNVGIIIVSNIRRNTTCHITLGTGFYEIGVPGSKPAKIYLRYAENYYRDKDGTEVITKLDETPTDTGYTYKGYKLGSTTIIDGKNILPNTKSLIVEDTTLTLVMEGNKYNIEYNYNGGTRGEENPTELTYGVNTTITYPARRGYDFAGWNISNLNADTYEIEGVTKSNPSPTQLSSIKSTRYKNLRADTGTVNFSATWDAKKPTVTYNANGGSVTPSSKTVTFGELYGELPTPTKTGYTFLGWFTEINGGDEVTSETKVNNPDNHTIYAHWRGTEYTITYYLGNGTSTAGSTAIGTSKCRYKESCTLETFASFNKTFPESTAPTSGCSHAWSFYRWSSSNSSLNISREDGETFTYETAGNINLYAVGRRYVSFYSGIAPTTYTGEYQYWNPHSTADAYLSDVEVKSANDISGWKFLGYKAGSNAATSGTTYAASQVGTKIKPRVTVCKANRGLYSRTLTLKYNGNGSTGGSTSNTTATQYYNSGVKSNGSNVGAKVNKPTFTLANNGFTKTGYTFLKWTEGSTSGTEYTAGDSYSNFGPAVDESSTTQNMYAKWKDATKPTVKITAYNYDESKDNKVGTTTLKSQQSFTSDGIFTVSSNWINSGVTFKIESSDSDSGIKNIVWKWNATGQSTDTGDTYSGGSSTYKTSFSVRYPTFTASGYRKGQWIVTDNDDNVLTITIVVKMDKVSPKSTYTTTTSKASLKCEDTFGLAGYYFGTKNSPAANDYTSVTGTSKIWDSNITSAGTYYVFCKDAAGNISSSNSKKYYSVSYNANGGTGAPSTQLKVDGTDITLSSTTPTRTGYVFNGWNTSSDGSGTNYASGGTYSVNANLTLYAKWKSANFSIASTNTKIVSGACTPSNGCGPGRYKPYVHTEITGQSCTTSGSTTTCTISLKSAMTGTGFTSQFEYYIYLKVNGVKIEYVNSTCDVYNDRRYYYETGKHKLINPCTGDEKYPYDAAHYGVSTDGYTKFCIKPIELDGQSGYTKYTDSVITFKFDNSKLTGNSYDFEAFSWNGKGCICKDEDNNGKCDNHTSRIYPDILNTPADCQKLTGKIYR